MKRLVLPAALLLALTAAAGAADLPMRPAPPVPYAAVPVFTWTGFYVGVNAGYGWNSNSNTVFDPATGVILSGSSGNNGGFIGGGQIGYNYQIGSFVLGAETDIQYADINHDRSLIGGNSSHNGYFGTVRARAGYAFDRALIYATGGFAYGGIESNNCGGSSSNVGWTLGGGMEMPLPTTGLPRSKAFT